MDMTIGQLHLTDQEENQIVKFLETLSDGYTTPFPMPMCMRGLHDRSDASTSREFFDHSGCTNTALKSRLQKDVVVDRAGRMESLHAPCNRGRQSSVIFKALSEVWV